MGYTCVPFQTEPPQIGPTKTNQPACWMNTEEARHLLGVTEETALSKPVLKEALRQARLIHHPDKGGSHERYVRLEKAHQTLVAKLIKEEALTTKNRPVITAPEFNDPNVIENCRRYENKALHGDDIDRAIYEVMRAFPGVAWPLVWPPAEDPVLTLVAVSDGAVTSGVQEAAPKQENKRTPKEAKNLESYNNPGKEPYRPAGNKRRRGRPSKSKKCDEEATTTKRYKRPPGAAPKGKHRRKKWCEMTGTWCEAEEAI